MEEKTCLDCGKPIKVGRKDKKFCDDVCRTNYNNNNKEKPVPEPALPAFIADINKILLENWKILHDCIGTQTTCRMRVRDLSGRNYNFKYFTSERANDQDEDIVYFFCYDIGYKVIEDGAKVLIVQNSNMVRLNGPAYVADRL